MEYSPPPLFKQGASARAKVVFFALIAIALLAFDARMQSLAVVRQAIGTALYPLQVAAMAPRDAVQGVVGYFQSLSTLTAENRALRTQQTTNARTLQQSQLLLSENAQLRKLLNTSQELPVKSVLGTILYDTRDPFTRKIVLDRGLREGVTPGQPVIDNIGVVGQVTRVFPFTSEVTLLTDRDQAIPVQVLRSGLRSVAYGRGQAGVLDLRFLPSNADIQKDDVLVTSGIDGIYPAGLQVATVAQIEHGSLDAFARITCKPMAGIDRNRQLLILLTEMKEPPRPPEEPKGRAGRPVRSLDHATNRGKDSAPVGDEAAPAKPAASATPAKPAAPAKPKAAP